MITKIKYSCFTISAYVAAERKILFSNESPSYQLLNYQRCINTNIMKFSQTKCSMYKIKNITNTFFYYYFIQFLKKICAMTNKI